MPTTQPLAFYKPADDSPEMQYLHGRRAALGGYLPARRSDRGAAVPPLDIDCAHSPCMPTARR